MEGSNLLETVHGKQSFKNSDTPASYMEMSRTGLYCLGLMARRLCFKFSWNPQIQRLRAILGYEGVFSIISFIASKWVQDLVKPVDICQRPLTSGKLGFC
ncbi:hypothetical protein ACLB2K_053041 [Fragaria x ananassa]